MVGKLAPCPADENEAAVNEDNRPEDRREEFRPSKNGSCHAPEPSRPSSEKEHSVFNRVAGSIPAGPPDIGSAQPA